MSPRELGGWTPSERHEHYDAEDNLTGYTVVIRESRIDDAGRSALLGLAHFEADVSAHRCGFHSSIALDKDNAFQPETVDCPVCAGLEQWERLLHEQDEKAAKANPDAPARAPRPSDGRVPYMRFLSPDEAEQIREDRTRGGIRGNKA